MIEYRSGALSSFWFGATKSKIAVSSIPIAATSILTGSLSALERFVVLNIVAPVPYITSSRLKGFIATPVIHQPGFSCPCQSSHSQLEISRVKLFTCLPSSPSFQMPVHVSPPSFDTKTLSRYAQRQSVVQTM